MFAKIKENVNRVAIAVAVPATMALMSVPCFAAEGDSELTTAMTSLATTVTTDLKAGVLAVLTAVTGLLALTIGI